METFVFWITPFLTITGQNIICHFEADLSGKFLYLDTITFAIVRWKWKAWEKTDRFRNWMMVFHYKNYEIVKQILRCQKFLRVPYFCANVRQQFIYISTWLPPLWVRVESLFFIESHVLFSISLVTDLTATRILSFRSVRFAGCGGVYTSCFTHPQKKKI